MIETATAEAVTADGECPFCAIVELRLPAATLFEDEVTMAFLDITAVTEGHTLVIPKRHAADLWRVSETEFTAVMRTVHRIAQRIREVLAPDGLTMFQANRAAGWQDVFHLHIHLVPRTLGDHLARPWTAHPVELDALATIRSRLRLP